ncbi:hypothetical protein HanXRQr2_Chr12g0547301 [Helianthus annuus]|uniref:Uncharacterized protein n=1 Tax=Helianthus annuus TaxID=4232 RepID=A0A251STQ2_HELAN|nr:hypothetical protein HanXRQr2_Chr12g0547301 [Helianthus annuus]
MFCSYLKVTGFFGGNRFNTIELNHQFLQLIHVSFNGSMFVFSNFILFLSTGIENHS